MSVVLFFSLYNHLQIYFLNCHLDIVFKNKFQTILNKIYIFIDYFVIFEMIFLNKLKYQVLKYNVFCNSILCIRFILDTADILSYKFIIAIWGQNISSSVREDLCTL